MKYTNKLISCSNDEFEIHWSHFSHKFVLYSTGDDIFGKISTLCCIRWSTYIWHALYYRINCYYHIKHWLEYQLRNLNAIWWDNQNSNGAPLYHSIKAFNYIIIFECIRLVCRCYTLYLHLCRGVLMIHKRIRDVCIPG